jgi:formylglycine-generating enzyme
MFGKAIVRGFLAVAVASCAVVAQADTITHGGTTINMDFVTVGDPGNTADTTGSPNPCGSVGYTYRIGKYEVTVDQWAAVIAADPNVGNAGNWSGSQPTGDTSWNEAAKFCNWLTTGHYDQGYYAVSGWDGWDSITPNALGHDAYAALHGTTYFIPTEDEWYKAAYYDGTAGVYYDYPTGTNSEPDGIDLDGDTEFDAVFGQGCHLDHPNAVANTGVASPYGTFAQGGNVFEWNERRTYYDGEFRGGSWSGGSAEYLHASYRSCVVSDSEWTYIGFRVASIVVPEPGSITLLVAGAIAVLVMRIRRK